MTAKLSDRIEAAEKELVEIKDALVEATKALEAAPDEEPLLIQVEELTTKSDLKSKTLEALKKAEKALASRSQPIDGAPGVAPNLQRYRDPNTKPGDLIFKMAVAAMKAHVQKQDIQTILKGEYPDMPVLGEYAKMIRYQKSQVDPAMTSTTGWAAELVQTDVRGYIDTLKDVSVAAALASRSMLLNFGGYNSITVPRRNPLGATPTEPAWVSEGSPIPLTQFSFGSEVINRFKLAAITTMTREVAERASPDLENILRDALREAHAEVLDAALLSTVAAVANVRPAGLLNGVTPIAGTAGGGEDAVRGDLLALVSAMTSNRLGSRPVLIMNNLDRLSASMMTSPLSEYIFRDDLNGGNLMSIPVISSANVPQHTVILVDAAYLATAFDLPSFDVSDVATVVEASADATPPTMASTDAGAAGTAGQVGPGQGIPVAGAGRPLGAADAGYTVRSLWQTYCLGIRMIAPTSWGKLQANIVEFSNDTTWTS